MANRYNSLDVLHNYIESEGFLSSPRYEEYAEHALRVAHNKLKIFNDSKFKHNDEFKERLDQILYEICALELMQFEDRERKTYAHHLFDRTFVLPDVNYLYNRIDEKIEELCHWGESHVYE